MKAKLLALTGLFILIQLPVYAQSTQICRPNTGDSMQTIAQSVTFFMYPKCKNKGQGRLYLHNDLRDYLKFVFVDERTGVIYKPNGNVHPRNLNKWRRFHEPTNN